VKCTSGVPLKFQNKYFHKIYRLITLIYDINYVNLPYFVTLLQLKVVLLYFKINRYTYRILLQSSNKKHTKGYIFCQIISQIFTNKYQIAFQL